MNKDLTAWAGKLSRLAGWAGWAASPRKPLQARMWRASFPLQKYGRLDWLPMCIEMKDFNKERKPECVQ